MWLDVDPRTSTKKDLSLNESGLLAQNMLSI